MAEIPYHQWLGMDSRIKNPHHFQLLGVSSKVVDSDSYRIQVLAAAQAKLEMLDEAQQACAAALELRPDYEAAVANKASLTIRLAQK